jgi:hypothetical protein
MGKDKTTNTTDSTSTSSQQVEQTAEEKRLNELDLAFREAGQPFLLKLQELGFDVSSNLLQGKALGGAFGDDIFGLSDEDIDDIARKSVADIQPGFQNLGIGDSGVAASLSAQTSGDVRRQSRQFNVGALQNALNLAMGSSAQVQGASLGAGNAVGQRLAGLRGITTTGTQRGITTLKEMNPFMKSFQTSLGGGLGERFGNIGGSSQEEGGLLKFFTGGA